MPKACFPAGCGQFPIEPTAAFARSGSVSVVPKTSGTRNAGGARLDGRLFCPAPVQSPAISSRRSVIGATFASIFTSVGLTEPSKAAHGISIEAEPLPLSTS